MVLRCLNKYAGDSESFRNFISLRIILLTNIYVICIESSLCDLKKLQKFGNYWIYDYEKLQKLFEIPVVDVLNHIASLSL